MDKPISVGDLVMVVRSHCGQYLGQVHRVVALEHSGPEFECSRCSAPLGPLVHAVVERHGEKGLIWPPLSWLKRIPSIEELDAVKREEEITA